MIGNALPEQIWRHASDDGARHRGHDPARERDVVLPQVHGDVLLVQRLLRGRSGTEQGRAVIRHRPVNMKRVSAQ